MAKLSRTELETGMVLQNDVKDGAGKLLIPAGATLSERHLRALAMWGIDQVVIEGGDEDATDAGLRQMSPAQEEAARSRARKLFKHCDLESEISRVLFDICVDRFARKALHSSRGSD